MTDCRPGSKPRSERAPERAAALTWLVLAESSHFSSAVRFILECAGLLEAEAYCPPFGITQGGEQVVEP
jgi:hypothetical protein